MLPHAGAAVNNGLTFTSIMNRQLIGFSHQTYKRASETATFLKKSIHKAAFKGCSLQLIGGLQPAWTGEP